MNNIQRSILSALTGFLAGFWVGSKSMPQAKSQRAQEPSENFLSRLPLSKEELEAVQRIARDGEYVRKIDRKK